MDNGQGYTRLCLPCIYRNAQPGYHRTGGENKTPSRGGFQNFASCLPGFYMAQQPAYAHGAGVPYRGFGITHIGGLVEETGSKMGNVGKPP